MTEKVKIPQKVADAIEKIREVHTNYGVVQLLEDDRVINQELLNSVGVLQIWTHEEEGDGRNADRLLDVLVNGYEIKPERLKVGNVVRYWRSGVLSRVGEIEQISYEQDWVRLNTSTIIHKISDIERMATDEECRKEKERQTWRKISRRVGEFRDGDIALDKFGRVLHTIEEMEAAYQMGDLSGFHPAGSYISFEEVDSNATTHH